MIETSASPYAPYKNSLGFKPVPYLSALFSKINVKEKTEKNVIRIKHQINRENYQKHFSRSNISKGFLANDSHRFELLDHDIKMMIDSITPKKKRKHPIPLMDSQNQTVTDMTISVKNDRYRNDRVNSTDTQLTFKPR